MIYAYKVSSLLLERVDERRITSTGYISLIPAGSLHGEGAGTCVDSYAWRERKSHRVCQIA
jgi:hypothetical protein